MRRSMLVLLALSLAGCSADSKTSRSASSEYTVPDSAGWGPRNDTLFRAHAAKVAAALGTFADITVFERPTADGEWRLVSGAYTPVTVDGQVPTSYEENMRSDRPMMLPTRVEAYTGGDGQSNPYNVAGRMPGSNPEVQWVFVVRQYEIKEPTDDDFAHSPDIAVIGHHPRTGATSFFQFYHPDAPRPAEVVISPFSEGAPGFWSPIEVIADSFSCQRCHDAGPFIHTPWVDQVRAYEADLGQPIAPPVVPSNPLGPYFFVDAEQEGDLFWEWNAALKHYDNPANKCTECHRIGNDMIGLNQNSTKYWGVPDGAPRNAWSVQADSFQTSAYEHVRWMPPVSMPSRDFYAGHEVVQNPSVGAWEINYGPSAEVVNLLTLSDSTWAMAQRRGEVVDVPRPPAEYSQIMVDRPHRDAVAPGRSLWMVDTRMRANTDGDLESWQFVASAGADSDVRVAPVVYRRRTGDGSTVEFDVVFVGEARSASDAGDWVEIARQGTFPVEIDSYFGLVFTNTGSAPAMAPVPYTEDEWAELRRADGSIRYENGYGHWQGYVTLQLETAGTEPAAGSSLVFKDADYRTYSFELRNRLGN